MRAAIALALCLALAACGGSPAPVACTSPCAAPQDAAIARHIASGHLYRHMASSPRTLDPSLSIDVQGQQLFDELFEGLVRLDGGSILPGMATRWESSADALVWTFHLDPAARWSDGSALTAADFVFSWRRAVDPATASQIAQQLSPLLNAREIISGKLDPSQLGVQALDAHTLRVQLASPTPYFLYLLTTGYLLPLPQAVIQRWGAAWTDPGKLVSNGPFVLADMRINGAIHLRRNSAYLHAADVRLAEVTYYPINDNAGTTARYLAGDLDVTDTFSINDLPWLKAQLGPQVLLSPYYGIAMLGFHTQRPPFNSKALRLALSLAVDRDLLTQRLLHGLYLPAYNLVPASQGYTPVLPEWAGLSAAARHARARQYYAEAGYSRAHPLVVDLAFPSGAPDQRRMFEALTAMWRVNLGAEVRLYSDEWRVHQQNRELGKYALFWDAWIGDYLDPLTFLGLMQKDSGDNHGHYEQPSYEAQLLAATQAADPAVRSRAYAEAEAVLNADAPIIPLYFYQSRHLLKPYVRGWKQSVVDRHPSRDLYLAEPRER